jgi:hypothetical protein
MELKMIKKLEELNKRRIKILENFYISKIDFNSSKRIISANAIKCKKDKFVDYRKVENINHNNFYTQRCYYNNDETLFKGNKINIAILRIIEDLQIKINDLCIEYYYFIKEYKIIISDVSRKLSTSACLYSFFNRLFIVRADRVDFGINKNKIKFLIEIDDILKEIIKGK